MHILCPHCQNPIEVVKLSPREEVTCPSCGSSFCLETGSTTAWESLAGRKLGKFELMGTIGQGAFGTVYKAHDPELDRIVAIKVLRAGNLAEPQELDRFLREARSVAQLRHPPIVSVHEVGQSDGVPYLVSDLVEGVTLADLLSGRRPGFREAAELVATIAEALHFAHERGVVHRDVKPSNIMLGEDGRPCVMDFGLAKREAGEITMTVEGQVLGTPAYVPPEQARGESHATDGRGDTYSLGVVLYQMLTGELPFCGTTRMLLHQVLHDEPRPPRRLNDRIPRNLETITLKAMAKEPGRRYATARELADDLRRWQKGEAIRARPVGAWERGWRWARRRPAVAGLLAGIVAVTALGLAGVSWQWLRAEERVAAETVARKAAEQAEQGADRARKDAEKAKEEEAKQRGEAEANLRAARLGLYASLLARADVSLRDNQFAEALKFLESCPPEHRGWEWKYLMRQSLGTPHVLLGHTGPVDCVAYSRDGTLLASCSRRMHWVSGLIDGSEVILWDAVSGRALHTFRDPLTDIAGVAFSPDGQRLAAAGARGRWNERGGLLSDFQPTLKVWDTKTGREIFSLIDERETLRRGPISATVAFSPDGQRVVTVGDSGTGEREVTVWDAASCQKLATLQNNRS
jgi:tRNA A-37 threonylcarbamoyl transferase component Bud32